MNEFFCCNKFDGQGQTQCLKKCESNEPKFTFDMLKPNEHAVVWGFTDGAQDKIKRRLLELGFVKDTWVTLENESQMGDVMLFNLNGYLLSMRRDVAKLILGARK